MARKYKEIYKCRKCDHEEVVTIGNKPTECAGCGTWGYDFILIAPANKHNAFYVTSFCNFPHRLRDGKPINHECYIIPPRLLRLEMEAECCTEGECGEAWREWSLQRNRQIMRRGVKE